MNIMNVAINAVTIIFYIFLVGIYVSKKNMDNIENKIYRKMLLWNGIDLIAHMAFLICGGLFREMESLVHFVGSFHSLALVLDLFYLVYYTVIVSNEYNKKFMVFYNNNNKKISTGICFFFTVLFIVFLILPLDILYTDSGMLEGASGPCALVMTVFLLIFTFIGFGTVIVNRKTSDKKKTFPLKLVGVMIIITYILLFTFPVLCTAVVAITLVSFLMYHTIENPDMKLIAELQLAKNSLEKANNAKSDFLSSMSHEIRTPLNAIVGLSQMIEYGDNMEDMKKDSKDIIVASNNLLEIVNGILDISKLEENKMEMIEDSYNPIEVFEDIAKLNINRIGSKEIELRCNYSPNLPRELYGDKEKLRQIINNLLSNAIKYTEKGYVDFIVECTNERDRSILKIMVSDTGRGIAPEEMDNLFTKFYRLKEDMDSDIGGTGLGLAITKSLVELFNGKIEVDSTVGVGSKFTVTLSQQLTTTVHQKPVYNIDDMKNNEIEVM